MLQFCKDWQPFFDVVGVISTAVLSFCVFLLAKQQNKINQAQAKIAARERRLLLYDSIMAFLANIQIRGTTDFEELRRMVRETRHATFLFPKKEKIRELIDELYTKGVELEYCEKDIQTTLQATGSAAAISNLVTQSHNLKKWFREKRQDIESQFHPYLSADDV